MPMVRNWISAIYVMFCLVLGVSVLAQDACPAIVFDALETVEDSCDDLERNSACYGSNNVQASFYQEVEDDYFTVPGDLTFLEDVETISTAPLDIENELWGVAVLQVQANIPNTLPGQNVVFVLLGDASLVDDVSADVERPVIDPIDVTVSANSNVRSGPSLRNNVITTFRDARAVQADGISDGGDWVRIIFDERPGWIFADLVTGDIADLPVVEGVIGGQMQAFHLSTGLGNLDCIQAPDAILVQGIEDFEIEFVVNGANVRIGSTAILELLSPEVMQISMIDGTGWVDDLRIPAGWKAQIELDPQGGSGESNGIDNLPQTDGQWTTCTPLDENDLARIQELSNFPQNLLNYPITVPRSGDGNCVSPTAAVQTTSSGGSATNSQIPDVDCSTFTLLSPFENITPRPTTFSWTEAPGATEYELVLHSVFSGQEAANIRTTETSITVTPGEFPIGSEMQWEVRAYRDGAYACVTYRTAVITLLADPEGIPSGGAFSAYWACAITVPPDTGNLTVSWANLPPGTTDIEVKVFNDENGIYLINNISNPPGSGSTVFANEDLMAGPPRDFHAGTVTAFPGGEVAAVAPFDMFC